MGEARRIQGQVGKEARKKKKKRERRKNPWTPKKAALGACGLVYLQANDHFDSSISCVGEVRRESLHLLEQESNIYFNLSQIFRKMQEQKCQETMYRLSFGGKLCYKNSD
ncbi:hypothetical protein K1719_002699 [Acacia pycnantha]|nr:hypothetical protein K1719_002699 [Acacia pycnantha]